MSIHTDNINVSRIKFEDPSEAEIYSVSGSLYVHSSSDINIEAIQLNVSVASISISNTSDFVILDPASRLKDAAGKILIDDGIWQFTGNEGKEVVIGPNPDSNANIVSIELDGSHFGNLSVASISLLARNSGSIPTPSAVWLSIWKQVSGDNYSLQAVSKEAKEQVAGQWTTWEFNDVLLTDTRIRIAALATPDTPFASASQLGLRVQERGTDDSCLIHGQQYPMQYHPAMIMREAAFEGFRIQEIESEDQLPQNPDYNTLYCIPET